MREAVKMFSEAVDRVTAAIESSSWLDGWADAVQRFLRSKLDRPGLRSLLSGSALGHPLHPLLTDLPIGCWSSAVVLDLMANAPDASRCLLGIGTLTALPTAVAGLSDWLDTDGAEKRVGVVHAAGNLAGTCLFLASWRARRRSGNGRVLALAGLVVASGAGWLGGHLSYVLGVGVDTNAFSAGPQDWTAIASKDVTDGLHRYETDCTGVVLAGTPSGLFALADRCSHRGGPLSEGHLESNCVVCPWHGSRFSLESGAVRSGPASVAQPTYEVRLADNAVEIRRAERRALRRNAVR
jgi:nitrite reductase/ring-hydroxylating ferredoxin subunit/uncharacterized membrane protein